MLAKKLSRAQLLQGTGLSQEAARYSLGNGETIYGYTDDVVYAMAWKGAARLLGVWCDVIDLGE